MCIMPGTLQPPSDLLLILNGRHNLIYLVEKPGLEKLTLPMLTIYQIGGRQIQQCLT